MSFDDDFKAGADCEVMDSFSIPAIYNGEKRINVVLDLDVEQIGQYDSSGPVKRHEVTFFAEQIPNPKRGQTIETAEGVYVLDGSIEGDHSLRRWHVNKR